MKNIIITLFVLVMLVITVFGQNLQQVGELNKNNIIAYHVHKKTDNQTSSVSLWAAEGVINIFTPSYIGISGSIDVSGTPQPPLTYQMEGLIPQMTSLWSQNVVFNDFYMNSFHDKDVGPGRDKLNLFVFQSGMTSIGDNWITIGHHVNYDRQAYIHSIAGKNFEISNYTITDRKMTKLTVVSNSNSLTISYDDDVYLSFFTLKVNGAISTISLPSSYIALITTDEEGTFLSIGYAGVPTGPYNLSVTISGSNLSVENVTTSRSLLATVYNPDVYGFGWWWQRPIKLIRFSPSGGSGGGGIPKVGINTKPLKYGLEQNYPNPFNPVTSINFSIPEGTNVTLDIYDIQGRLVETLIDNEHHETGKYTVPFDASDFASGTYFYKITAGKYTQVKKMTLLK
ncbi:MAG: T9SS type A sorting domain-containing protein [bacterium]